MRNHRRAFRWRWLLQLLELLSAVFFVALAFVGMGMVVAALKEPAVQLITVVLYLTGAWTFTRLCRR